jgi:hypothetical protein
VGAMADFRDSAGLLIKTRGIQMKKVIVVLLLLGIIPAGCRNPAAERKIDPYLKIKMAEMLEKNQLDQKIPILFRVTDELSPTHKMILQKNGVEIKANIAHIYTASATPEAIYNLANMRFVDTIEASKELQRQIDTAL